MTQAYLEDYSAFAANGGTGAPAWLTPLRRQAIDRFGALGFPTTKNEDWHYTSVAPIAERVFRPAPARAPAVTRAELAPFLFDRPDWTRLVFVNGRPAPALSHAGTPTAGLRVENLAAALAADPSFIERHLSQVAAFDQQTFTALNTAFVSDGALVVIPADAALDSPIHLIWTSSADDLTVSHPRTLVIVGPRARATIIESYIGLRDSSYFTNAVTEVQLGDGATLRHCKLQRESPRAYHVGSIEVRQGRDSHYESFSFATGAVLSRTNIATVLGGEGCGATLNGLYMLDGEQHGDHQTRIEHAQPNTFSRELYKGILDGSSHGVFNGKVYVHPVAQKTDGKQTNNTLLLSERARIDTKPQLEIFADDVKCTHGATVGRLDEVALFYMKSRGISAPRARQLLTYAFAADVLERIEEPAVREGLEAMVLARFTKERSAVGGQRSEPGITDR